MSTSAHILVVIGSPIADSLNHALADAYAETARAGGAEVRTVDLAADAVPQHPSSRAELRTPRTADDVQLTDDVAGYTADVEWADHLVFFFPQWWGTYPAALKAYIDRVFLSGFAFRYGKKASQWEKLLSGRTARIVMTMDSPAVWNSFAYRDAAIRALRNATLEYCGVRVRAVTRLAGVRDSALATREQWVTQAAAFGTKDAATTVHVERGELVTA